MESSGEEIWEEISLIKYLIIYPPMHNSLSIFLFFHEWLIFRGLFFDLSTKSKIGLFRLFVLFHRCVYHFVETTVFELFKFFKRANAWGKFLIRGGFIKFCLIVKKAGKRSNYLQRKVAVESSIFSSISTILDTLFEKFEAEDELGFFIKFFAVLFVNIFCYIVVASYPKYFNLSINSLKFSFLFGFCQTSTWFCWKWLNRTWKTLQAYLIIAGGKNMSVSAKHQN